MASSEHSVEMTYLVRGRGRGTGTGTGRGRGRGSVITSGDTLVGHHPR